MQPLAGNEGEALLLGAHLPGLAAEVCRQLHLDHGQVQPAIAIDVGDVRAHRRERRVPHRPLDHVAEGAVRLAEVEIVGAGVVVGDVDVGDAVAVQVPHAQAEAEAEVGVDEPDLGRHVREAPSVIPVQLVDFEGGAAGTELEQRPVGRDPVVHEVHVEVAVAIAVEECRLRRIRRVVQAVGGGLLGEDGNTVPRFLVDVQHVAPQVVLPEGSRLTDVDVESAVGVDVGQGHSGGPSVGRARDPRALRHILETQPAPVEIQPVGTDVGREIEVGEIVPVQVSDTHPRAVVVVLVGQPVPRGRLRQAVGEGDARLRGGHECEEPFGAVTFRAPTQSSVGPACSIRAACVVRAGRAATSQGSREEQREGEQIAWKRHRGSSLAGAGWVAGTYCNDTKRLWRSRELPMEHAGRRV